MYARAKSRERSRATRSPCRSATSPESAALTEREVERPQLNLEHPAPMRGECHTAVQHRVLGKARVEKPDVGQRRRVGPHDEVPEQRVARPLDRAARAELGAGE